MGRHNRKIGTNEQIGVEDLSNETQDLRFGTNSSLNVIDQDGTTVEGVKLGALQMKIKKDPFGLGTVAGAISNTPTKYYEFTMSVDRAEDGKPGVENTSNVIKVHPDLIEKAIVDVIINQTRTGNAQVKSVGVALQSGAEFTAGMYNILQTNAPKGVKAIAGINELGKLVGVLGKNGFTTEDTITFSAQTSDAILQRVADSASLLKVNNTTIAIHNKSAISNGEGELKATTSGTTKGTTTTTAPTSDGSSKGTIVNVTATNSGRDPDKHLVNAMSGIKEMQNALKDFDKNPTTDNAEKVINIAKRNSGLIIDHLSQSNFTSNHTQLNNNGTGPDNILEYNIYTAKIGQHQYDTNFVTQTFTEMATIFGEILDEDVYDKETLFNAALKIDACKFLGDKNRYAEQQKGINNAVSHCKTPGSSIMPDPITPATKSPAAAPSSLSTISIGGTTGGISSLLGTSTAPLLGGTTGPVTPFELAVVDDIGTKTADDKVDVQESIRTSIEQWPNKKRRTEALKNLDNEIKAIKDTQTERERQAGIVADNAEFFKDLDYDKVKDLFEANKANNHLFSDFERAHEDVVNYLNNNDIVGQDVMLQKDINKKTTNLIQRYEKYSQDVQKVVEDHAKSQSMSKEDALGSVETSTTIGADVAATVKTKPAVPTFDFKNAISDTQTASVGKEGHLQQLQQNFDDMLADADKLKAAGDTDAFFKKLDERDAEIAKLSDGEYAALFNTDRIAGTIVMNNDTKQYEVNVRTESTDKFAAIMNDSAAAGIVDSFGEIESGGALSGGSASTMSEEARQANMQNGLNS